MIRTFELSLSSRLAVAFFILTAILFSSAGAAQADGRAAMNARGQDRVHGGERVRETQAPWAVVLLKDGKFYCGGSLVAPEVFDDEFVKWVRGRKDPRWVITAAHCLYDNVPGSPPLTMNRLKVRTATLDRTGSHLSEDIELKAVIEHPHYNKTTLENDIALLLLESPKKDRETSLRGSIGLPRENELGWINEPYLQLYALGWGATEATKAGSEKLLQVRIPRFDDDLCRKNYKKIGADVLDGMICAGYARGEFDSCQGDSGGSLVFRPYSGGKQIHHKQLLDQAVLAGVVSWGEGCALKSFPGIYSSITYYQRWLEKSVIACERKHKEGCTQRSTGTGRPSNVVALDPTRRFVPMISGEVQLYPEGCQQNGECKLGQPIRFQQSVNVAWESDAWPGSGQQSGTTDGASIPGWAQPFIGEPFEQSYLKAAILHDHYCYKENNVRPWRDVHRMFYDALIASGVNRVKARIMYLAVRTFGPRWTWPNNIPFELCGAGCIKQSRNVTAQQVDHKWIKPRYDHAQADATINAFKAVAEQNLSLEEFEKIADKKRADLGIENAE